MDWTSGYASDIEYVNGYYREQNPSFLNFVCVLNGIEPVRLDQGFSYFELGFGRGFTLNMLAACYPQAQFYGADFNPAHVVGAQELSRSVGLDNIQFLENSFEELATGQGPELQQFDFIALHGIYTWVTALNRQHIVNFIARYLKPGGIVYVSYNAMPGWASALPLQRLFVEHADLHPARSDLQMNAAITFASQLKDANAAYFLQNGVLEARMAGVKTANVHYLVHEYMHKHWQPLYHADVARDMAPAKLNFAGSAELSMTYENLYLTPERKEALAQISDLSFRETLKDFCLNTAFRKDVYVRGARTLPASRREELLREYSLGLLVPRAEVKYEMKLLVGEVSTTEALYAPVVAALERQASSLAELGQLPELGAINGSGMGQIAALLTAANYTEICWRGELGDNRRAVEKLNQFVAQQTRFGDEFQNLASPVLRSAVSASFVERLLYKVMSENKREAFEPDFTRLIAQTQAVLLESGRVLLHEGAAITDPEDVRKELEIQVGAFFEKKLPIWRQLGIV